MMLVLLVYLTDLLVSLGVFLYVVAIMTGLFGGVMYLWGWTCEADASSNNKEPEFDVERMKHIGKRFLITFFTSIALIVIIPSQKTMYTIIGVYYAPKIVETVKDNALFNKSIKLLEQKIDKALSEE